MSDEKGSPDPCPWCGATREEFRVEVTWPVLGESRYHLECRRCGLRGPGGGEAQIVAMWNVVARGGRNR